MKKFKIISICASFVLMIALMAFGVYAASSATFSITSSVEFKVQNVFVEVSAGLGDAPAQDATYYYSQPSGSQLPLTQLTALPNVNFDDEAENGNVITYHIYVKNLHSRDIKIRFGFEWSGSSKYNYSDQTAGNGAVQISSYVNSKIGINIKKDKDITPAPETPTKDEESLLRTDVIKGDSLCSDFLGGETRIFVVTLTLKSEAEMFALKNSALKLKMSASLDNIESI